VARLRDAQPGEHHDGVRLFDRAGQDLPGERRAQRRPRSGVRQERQVPVLPGVHRRGAGQRLVRPVERRHALHLHDLPRRAAQRPAVAARARERRGEAGVAETPEKKPDAAADQKAGEKAGPTPEQPAARKDAPFRIDFEGLEFRILDLPIPPAELRNLQVGTAGQVYYLKTADGGTSLQRYDLNTRKNETLLPSVNDYVVSADGKKLLYRSGQNWSIVPTTRRIEPAEGRIAVDSIEVRIDPRAEWRQIFDEAWRINRDYFYAANMHGVDWAKQREKYAAFLPHAATRADVNRILQWMSSELAVGHHNVGGGDSLAQPRSVPGGLLGADYEVANGRYRLKKVYGGLNWNPQLRAPLTEPGVNARAGEYLLAVNGRDLRPPTNLYSLFENTSGKIVELTLGPNADGRGRGPCRSCRSPTRRRSATATGSKAT
jgi:tricorn protease